MADFPLRTVTDLSQQISIDTKSLQFGDGYEQLSRPGLNLNSETWTVMVVIDRAADSALLDDFLIEHGQFKSFNWKSPCDDELQLYKIDGAIGDTNRNGGGSKPVYFTRQIKFRGERKQKIEPVRSVTYYDRFSVYDIQSQNTTYGSSSAAYQLVGSSTTYSTT